MLRRLLGQHRTEPVPPSAETACLDADPCVRASGVRQLSDPHRLMRLRSNDPDRLVRDAAADRLRLLLTGGDDCLAVGQRLAALDACNDATLLAHVARRAREVDLRLAAVRRVSGERLLAEIALEDADCRVRLAAVERLTDADVLADLDQRFRRRDARLARRARQRYDTLMHAREQGDRLRRDAEILCDEMEQVIARPGNCLEACLDRLGNRRARLEGEIPADVAERFDHLMQEGRRLCAQRRAAVS